MLSLSRSALSDSGLGTSNVLVQAAVEPDLQAQVMAAYRNMKLKQREAAKKPASRHKSR